MTPEVKRKALNAVWECLRTSPAGTTLANGCREKLLGKHLEHLERSPEIITTLDMPYGNNGGWFTLWQVGGGLKVILWVQPLIYRIGEVRAEIQQLQRTLHSILHSEIQLRVKEPFEWLKMKGWPYEEGGGCTGAKGQRK